MSDPTTGGVSLGEAVKPREGEKKEHVVAGKTRVLVKMTLTSQQLSMQMSALDDSAVESFVAKTVEVQISQVDISIFAIFEFQGFDPDAIIRKLLILKDHYGLSDEELKEDIMYMIAANIYMGNLSGKAMGRRSQDGRDMIDDLVARYKIQAGTTGTGKSSDIITFPRVAGSFPIVSCRMATRLPTKTMVGQAFKSEPVPRFMRMSAFASFCKAGLKERSRLFLLKCVAAYSCDQSIVFEVGKRKKLHKTGDDLKVDPLAIGAEQWPFIWNAAESKVPNLSQAKKMMIEFNVSGLFETLKPVVENYNIIMNDPTSIPSKADFEADITQYVTGS
jgi:hypothetical protein